MIVIVKYVFGLVTGIVLFSYGLTQKPETIILVKKEKGNRIDVLISGKLFTSFLYPDTLEKPVLYPVFAAGGERVTRGFPLLPAAGEPSDHPHHVGIWFTYENVNGIDFWNNSFAIGPGKKHLYGWVRTDRILEMKSSDIGVLKYHANWTNQQKETLLEENTRLEFSGSGQQRIIDRETALTADTDIRLADAKDGLLGFRLAHELQIPETKDQQFTDDKGNVTVIKAATDHIATGNYLTSEGKTGNDAWGTRAIWCMIYGKIGNDSVSVAIIDHPGNPNYPTFWHARGYGLFAANPLGEKIFTNGKSEKQLLLKKGDSVRFRFRIIVNSGKRVMSRKELDEMAAEFAKWK